MRVQRKKNWQMMNVSIVAGIAGALLASAGCSPVPGPDKSFAGAVLGAGWGAGAGAIIGNQTDEAGAGAGIGAGFGAVSGLIEGVGLDLAEGTELEQQRELDAVKVRVASNQRQLLGVQRALDNRDRMLEYTAAGSEIYFDKGSADISTGAAMKLERLSQSLKINPYVGAVEIHGHSDDGGSDTANQALGERRAQAVATFLANRGVSFNKFQIISHGASQQMAGNSGSPLLNRRVEIVFLR